MCLLVTGNGNNTDVCFNQPMVTEGGGFKRLLFNKYVCLNYTLSYVDDEVF